MPFDGFLTGDGNHAPAHVKNGNFVLNKDSPQARGLAFWSPIQNNGNVIRDFAGGQVVTTDTPVAVSPIGGYAYDSENAVSQLFFGSNDPDVRNLTAFTASLRAVTTAVGGNKILGGRDVTTAYQFKNSFGRYQFECGSATTIDTAIPTAHDGIPRCHVGRLDGANVEYWIDGISRGTQTDAIAMRAGTTVILQGDLGEGLRWWDVRENLVALTDAVCVHIFTHPWDLYYELGKVSYFFVPAAGGVANPHNPLGHPLIGPFGGPV